MGTWIAASTGRVPCGAGVGGAGGRLPKARCVRVYCAIHHHRRRLLKNLVAAARRQGPGSRMFPALFPGRRRGGFRAGQCGWQFRMWLGHGGLIQTLVFSFFFPGAPGPRSTLPRKWPSQVFQNNFTMRTTNETIQTRRRKSGKSFSGLGAVSHRASPLGSALLGAVTVEKNRGKYISTRIHTGPFASPRSLRN